MVEQTISNESSKKWYNPLNLLSGGYSSQIGQDGDASIGSGLVNVTKKEQKTLNLKSEQNVDNRDLSRTSMITNTDARSLTYTNAPTIILGGAGGNVTGANTSTDNSPNVAPTIQTKKESKTEQSSTQRGELSSGLDLNKLALYGAIGGVILLGLNIAFPKKKVAKK